MSETIFSKILRGEIPCHEVYQDEHVLAFLDINPLSLGHTLVIPKEAKAELHELSDESAAAIGRAALRVLGNTKPRPSAPVSGWISLKTATACDDSGTM